MPNIKIDKDDFVKVIDYIMLLNEKKDWEECGKPKNHIWVTIRRIMKQVKYKEVL